MSKKENFVLIMILGTLCTISPFAVDMYLPGFPAIAQSLNISANTVKFHVNAILSKLDAQSRTEAVVRATQLGIIVL